MNAQRAPAGFLQRLQIAGRLRVQKCTERVGAARQRHIGGNIGRELHEQARVRPALVVLPRGMQKARPVARRGGQPVARQRLLAQGQQGVVQGWALGEVGLQIEEGAVEEVKIAAGRGKTVRRR